MKSIALLTSILVAGCASDDGKSLTGHWDRANCANGLPASEVTITVGFHDIVEAETHAGCNDLSFTLGLGDLGGGDVTIQTDTFMYWGEFVTFDHDVDLGLITFVQGPLED
ncbi:MAG: hypothetical protein QM831_35195 [Kofleriaceae bacterium]